MQDIVVLPVKKNRKNFGGKKIPYDVPLAIMDKESFHSEDSVLKWKYVYHRRIAGEREISEEAMKCEEIIELLQDSQVMKNVFGLSHCRLVKKFIVNISKDFNKYGSKDYRRVDVHDCCIGLSLAVINDHLGRGKLIIVDKVPNMNIIAQEITGSTYEDCPSKDRSLQPI